MKITVPKIVKKLDLREYAAEMETEITVWVNPPRAMLLKQDELKATSEGLVGRAQNTKDREELGRIGDALNGVGLELAGWYAEIWSQGADEATHWSREEIEALMEHAGDTDPGLWVWLAERTKALIRDHRNAAKKK